MNGDVTELNTEDGAALPIAPGNRAPACQIRVALICGLIQMCDGYDVGTIGWSVPSLTHAWQMAPSAFALALPSRL